MKAPPVNVEVHLANGLPSFTIVGLPDTEVRASKYRVRAALQNAGVQIPNRRVTINLAPADLPKGSQDQFRHSDTSSTLAFAAAADAARTHLVSRKP